MPLHQALALARVAGALGKPLPNLGAPLTRDALTAINTAYDVARNEHAAKTRR